jgi:hypothetical protein
LHWLHSTLLRIQSPQRAASIAPRVCLLISAGPKSIKKALQGVLSTLGAP